MSKKVGKAAVELTVMNTDTPSLLDALNAKIKALKHIEDSVYKTSGNLEGFGDIKQELKIENLIRAFSMVMGKADAYAKASVELGLDSVPAFQISGGTVADWKQDISLRIQIINHKETLDKLNGFKSKMESFLSEQDKKALLMKEMEDFFKKSN